MGGFADAKSLFTYNYENSASYSLHSFSAHSEFGTHSSNQLFHMTSMTLVSFTEDTGNLAVAMACVHPICEIELTGRASAFSFKILNIFNARQGPLFWKPGETRGSGKKPSLLLPHSSGMLRLSGAVAGTPRPPATSCSRTGGVGGSEMGIDQAPSAHLGNLPRGKNPQQDTAMYFLFVQCTMWYWRRNQSSVEGLSQYVIFKLEELRDKHLFNIHFGL